MLKSSEVKIKVCPGPPSAIALVSSAPANMRLSAANGSNESERTLLRDVVVQVMDSFGNPSPVAGIAVAPLLTRHVATIPECPRTHC